MTMCPSENPVRSRLAVGDSVRLSYAGDSARSCRGSVIGIWRKDEGDLREDAAPTFRKMAAALMSAGALGVALVYTASGVLLFLARVASGWTDVKR